MHKVVCSYTLVFITGRNEVLAKVIFSQACVILFTGGFLQIFGGGLVPGGSPPEYGQRSVGTHPTGMHSCFQNNSFIAQNLSCTGTMAGTNPMPKYGHGYK